jgi:hypothetical protein
MFLMFSRDGVIARAAEEGSLSHSGRSRHPVDIGSNSFGPQQAIGSSRLRKNPVSVLEMPHKCLFHWLWPMKRSTSTSNLRHASSISGDQSAAKISRRVAAITPKNLPNSSRGVP